MSILWDNFRTIDWSNEKWLMMAANSRFLLSDQYPNFSLYDRELTLVKQLPWEHDRISDLCWSSTLNSFITTTGKVDVFLLDENLTSIEPIEIIEKKEWLSCSCSDAALFLTTNKYIGSYIFQFHLLSSFNLIKQWNPPKSCESNEVIRNIAYNNETLALTISQKSTKKVKIELVSSTTLDRLWSLFLDLTHNDEWVYRVCLLRCDEWLVIGHIASRPLHISKDGKLKITQKHNPIPENAVLFVSNILAIRTTKSMTFYIV